MGETPLLTVDNLQTHFRSKKGVVKAVDGVSFDIRTGETLGVVGESGSGKSVTALSILRLIESPPGEIVGGSMLFRETDLRTLPERQMRTIRGKEISMIFQEPMTSLHPIYTVGNQMVEAIRLHTPLSKKAARDRAIEMLGEVEIPDPAGRFVQYPHELSGGMRQRVMIAMALSCEPKLLIADEPTTALDVTVQARILELMNNLKSRFGTAILMITHDLGVIAETCDRVVVMYAGRVVEYGGAENVFKRTRHPYTLGLLDSIPPMEGEPHRLQAIPGTVPSPMDLPRGCKFNSRCRFATDKCFETEPELEEGNPGHYARCWHSEKVAAEVSEVDA
jgi:peptide/nickel transport system ATP-binding protein/oligopeptide transport system ATP-binding protein